MDMQNVGKAAKTPARVNATQGVIVRNIESPAQPPEQITATILMNEQNQEVMSLHEIITSLEARLSDVLRPAYPSQDGKGESSSASSPLSQLVERHTAIICQANCRLSDILSRIDI